MRIYRVTKFLVACGIASVLLVGCGSDSDNNGPALSTISSPEEAAAASAAIQGVMSGSFDPDLAAKFKSPRVTSLLATKHSAKVNAIKAQKAKFATKAASFVTEIGVPQACDEGTYTVTAFTEEENKWIYAATYDHCKYIYPNSTEEENGSYSESWVYNPDTGFTTWTYTVGNKDGVATLASDYSFTYKSGDYIYITVEDMNEKYVYYDDYSTDFTDKAYSGFSRGQMTVSAGEFAGKITVNTSESGSESLDTATNTSTDKYKFSGSMTMSSVVAEETTETSWSANVSGISTYNDNDWTETDAPNGIITLKLTMPTPYDCSAVSGTYKIATVTPLIYNYFQSGYPLAGELLINNNTTVEFYGPGSMTVTLAGVTEPAFDGLIEDLLYEQSATCPLVAGGDMGGPV